MTYQVQLFAALRERTGKDIWECAESGPLTGSELLERFFTEHNEVEGLRPVTRLAVNQTFCHDDPTLDPGDELALIPPVSGG